MNMELFYCFRRFRRWCAQHIRIVDQFYAWVSVVILLSSTVWWSLQASRLQQGNADQLVDGFLLRDMHSLSTSVFPAAHTLFLKWPLFWVLGQFHYSATIYSVETVLVTVVSVALLAYVLFRIIRRPLVFGVVCLLLACVLVLVPAQILGGVTAPLNMALLTGRNLEYVLYIGFLGLYIRATGFKSWPWLAATMGMAVLFVSDQLFLTLSLGGAITAFVTAYGVRYKKLGDVAIRWLVGSGIAWALATMFVGVLNKYLTSIVKDGSGAYGPINSWYNVVPAITYGFKAIALNLGVTVKYGPFSLLPGFINLGLFILILFGSYRVVRTLFLLRKGHIKTSAAQGDTANMLALLLLISTFAAFIAYIATAHAYQADARYLSISLFAGFVVLAVIIRSMKLSRWALLATGGVTAIALMSGLIGMTRHTNQIIAADQIRRRNERIAQTLIEHPVEMLVGSYWRVIPIKALSKQSEQDVVPLRNCTRPIPSLINTEWQKNLLTHSFAYILSLGPTGTPFPACSLPQIEYLYGPPTSIKTIAGTAHVPSELLLRYDKGASNKPKALLPSRPGRY
jgi:hypothetical protein